ncbi:Na(+)/H(+) antiporter subunit C [Paeniglutamicibacter gangotriensis]|uniref:Monovalent cation/H+ antiporter subunit C n=2 Tax=Paeniglutamicibacter gangotriensis TaxID=254787 RepID=M7NJX1_9MICC|nr:Na(+)/H(+) antiporter subunit C [Paeniglutamicibacter gangotriensis]EMQ98818.1 monovalent cation/H+ antiporter subunit C [Paeniglutamicibacter gangotriensis Lz1y]KAA0973720.1 Na(+)/H(+) antiporter subunit C [Paeniglutamicibacter gangotriensis]
MSTNITLLIVMGVLFAVGFYLLLERSLTRVLLGIVVLGNGVNLLLLSAGGRRGQAPLYEESLAAEDYTDPLPQALILTAIVITFAVTAFMLAMIYRSWVISRADVVTDDLEDLRVSQQSTFDFEEDSPVPEDTTEFDGDVDLDLVPVKKPKGKGPRA